MSTNSRFCVSHPYKIETCADPGLANKLITNDHGVELREYLHINFLCVLGKRYHSEGCSCCLAGHLPWHQIAVVFSHRNDNLHDTGSSMRQNLTGSSLGMPSTLPVKWPEQHASSGQDNEIRSVLIQRQQSIPEINLIARSQVAAAPALRYQIEPGCGIRSEDNFPGALGINESGHLVSRILIRRSSLHTAPCSGAITYLFWSSVGRYNAAGGSYNTVLP